MTNIMMDTSTVDENIQFRTLKTSNGSYVPQEMGSLLCEGKNKNVDIDETHATISYFKDEFECEVENKDAEIDGSWSFVVALASFIAQGLLGGYVYTGGIYYTVFRHEFPNTNTVAISWLCTLPLTLWFVASPIGSVITNKFGYRTCSLVGGFTAALGLSVCFFATNFYILFLCYGIIGGIGNGIQYIGFITAVSKYFSKYRAVFNIVTTVGLTVGMAIYSFLVPYLNSQFGFRGSLLILGGITFNLCVCACVLFPLKGKQKHKRIFNFALLKQKYFLLFCCEGLFCNLSNSMTILHLPSMILSFNLGSTIVSLSLTLYGVFNSAAKILHSIIGHFRKPDASVVYTISLIVCGFVILVMPLVKTVEWIMCFSALLGFTYSVTGGHYIEIVLELTGPEHFADGVGIAQVFKACGTLLAGPLAGSLFQQSGHYSVTFYCSGTIMVVGCFFMIPILVKKLRSTKQSDINEVSELHVSQNEKCLQKS